MFLPSKVIRKESFQTNKGINDVILKFKISYLQMYNYWSTFLLIPVGIAFQANKIYGCSMMLNTFIFMYSFNVVLTYFIIIIYIEMSNIRITWHTNCKQG